MRVRIMHHETADLVADMFLSMLLLMCIPAAAPG
jgi:hypothetical protein